MTIEFFFCKRKPACFVILLFGFLLIIGTLVFLADFLSSAEKDFALIKRKIKVDTHTRITFLDSRGSLLIKTGLQSPDHYPVYKKYISINDIDPEFIKDLLIFEDRSFYDHWGFSFSTSAYAVVRHIFHSLQKGIYSLFGHSHIFSYRGGSTITQQTVKIMLDNPPRTIKNKMKEIYLALRLELFLYNGERSRVDAKKRVLEIYLNNVYTGFRTRGIASASMILFGKDSINNLSQEERIMLIAVIHAPGVFYTGNIRIKETIINKITYVLMNNHRIFHKADASDIAMNYGTKKNALLGRLAISPRSAFINAWFFYHPVPPSEKVHLFYRQDLDQRLNQRFNAYLEKVNAVGKKPCTVYGAFSVIHPKTNTIISAGEAKCSTFNELTARRPVSSVIKPLIYLSAMDKFQWQPNYIVNDSRITVEIDEVTDYSPENYYRFPKGDLSLKSALKFSSNTVSLKILNSVGIDYAYSRIHRVFYPEMRNYHQETTTNVSIPKVYSLALGTLEAGIIDITHAYSVILREGKIAPLRWSHQDPPGKDISVYSPRSAWQMKEMLTGISGVLGTGYMLSMNFSEKNPLIAKEIGGKSGSNERDSWFIGYTEDLIIGVWLGSNNAKKKKNFGAVAAWYKLMEEAVKDYPQRPLSYPDALYRGYYCTANGSFKISNCRRIESSVFLKEGGKPGAG